MAVSSVVDFGRRLIQSRDLDPVYVALHGCPELAKRPDYRPGTAWAWLVAYWSFYHVGTASWIVDGLAIGEPEYWSRHGRAANSKGYPRCSERRHYRAENARKSHVYLSNRGLTGLWNDVALTNDAGCGWSCDRVMKAVQKWVAFKAADMLERLELLPIQFSTSDAYLFDSPMDGARLLREEMGAEVDDAEVASWATSVLIAEYDDLLAPPAMDRPIGPQEVETVLCKAKSHHAGRYHVGEDIEAVRLGLDKFRLASPIARAIQANSNRQGLFG